MNISDIVSKNFTDNLSRRKPRLNRGRAKQNQAGNYGHATFTVVNDRAYPPEPPQMATAYPRKMTKRNIITSRDPRGRIAASMTSGQGRTVPEPHRQILDPKVQKEIAMLQGKMEVTLNNGPGPGIKGLRHIPCQTARSLNERFTEERMVAA